MIEIDLSEIADNHSKHSRETDWWRETNSKLQDALQSSKEEGDSFSVSFSLGNHKTIGPFAIPNLQMGGGITSKSLFGLDELILFSYYARNASKYQSAADLGANIGLHSLMLSELGYSVSAFEPDPQTTQVAKEILTQARNNRQIFWNQSAVVPDTFSGEYATFVRVLGNTTSSHVKGAKNPYGALEEFKVSTERFSKILTSANLVKLDVEGLEGELFRNFDLPPGVAFPDTLAEIGNPENALVVFSAAMSFGLNLFSQKTSWEKVELAKFMPTSYREGSVFISSRESMPWG